jgi:hypothetical protein
MVMHWRRMLGSAVTEPGRPGPLRLHTSLAINAAGAVVTATALGVILIAKFTEGAWITVLVIPCTLILLKSIKHYYERLERALGKAGPIRFERAPPPVIVIPIDRLSRLTEKAVRFALTLSPDVIAVHLTKLGGPGAEEKHRSMKRQWAEEVERPAREAGLKAPPLVLLPSPYRRFCEPLLMFIRRVDEEHPRQAVMVLIPQIIEQHWWEHLLHHHRAYRLRSALLRYGGPDLVVVIVPWYLEPPRIDEALPKDEATRKEAAVIRHARTPV